VLVQVAFAGITFVDTQIRQGHPPNPAMIPELPAVLGTGVGGVVAAVGAGVDPALIGLRVVTHTGGRGGYAEVCAVPAGAIIAIPDSLMVDEAVALLADGRTALALTDAAAPVAGETVLVEAAAGGVGSLLLQLLAQADTRVVALAGGPRKLRVAAELGAEIGIDYRRPDWAAAVVDRVGSVDLVFDGVGGRIGSEAFRLLAASGRYVPFGMASGRSAGISADVRPDVARVSLGKITPDQSAHLTRRALDLAAAGRLRPVIGQRLPLERVSDAHAAIEARTTIGKTLLVVHADAGGRPAYP
jgi:NADPH2:quinone reductase